MRKLHAGLVYATTQAFELVDCGCLTIWVMVKLCEGMRIVNISWTIDHPRHFRLLRMAMYLYAEMTPPSRQCCCKSFCLPLRYFGGYEPASKEMRYDEVIPAQ
jgi:hypothetical protein